MDQHNPKNAQKYLAFEEVGYDVQTQAGRRAAAADVERQLRDSLSRVPAFNPELTEHGARLTTEVVILGPNGRSGTLTAVWQYDTGSQAPRLITNYLKAHR